MPTDVTKNFTYTGALQSFTFPWNITGDIVFVMLGAAGGDHDSSTQFVPKKWGGRAGRIVATLDASIYRGKTIYIYVGGRGNGVDGGYNGGGDGWDTANTISGIGGGGASDVRVNGTAYSNRILVAAGGGGASIGSAGGDGGPSAGETAPGGFGMNGTGGTQTSGGSGGTHNGSGAYDGADGVLGHGGHGGHVTVTTSGSNGAGGGGGYYGGGGGGGDITNYSGGGGGGGSNFIASYPTVQSFDASDRGMGNQTSNGNVAFSYTVLDPVSSGVSMGASGGIGSTPLVSHPASIPVLTSAQLAVTAISATREALAVRATLATAHGTESIFGNNTLLVARSSLTTTGFRTTVNVDPFVASAALAVKQTSSSELFQAFASLALPSGQRTLPGTLATSAAARLVFSGLNTHHLSLSMSGRGTLSIQTLRTVWGTLTMAARASQSLAGRLSELNGVLVYPRATMVLSGLLTDIGHLAMAVTTNLTYQIQLKHIDRLNLAASTSLTVTPRLLVFVGPSMAAYAELDLGPLVLGSPVHMSALAEMLIDLDPSGGVYDAPYLIVTDAHNTVKFFVRGYPTPGQLRQVVTNVHSRF